MIRIMACALLLGCFANCKNSRKATSNHTEPSMTVEAAAMDYFKDGYTIFSNESNTFALVIKEVRIRPNQLNPTLDLFVFDIEKGKHIYQTTVPKGSAKWISNEEILMSSIPGVYHPNEKGRRYIFNVITKSENPSKSK